MWATSIDGMAQPPQLVPRSTPKGRGLRATTLRTPTTYIRKFQTSSHTIRCRQRRRTSSAAGSPIPSTERVHQDPTCARPRRSARSPGACSSPSHRTTMSSATVTGTAGPRSPRRNTTTASPTSTTRAISQPTPLVWSRYGNGGGAPVGAAPARRPHRLSQAGVDQRRPRWRRVLSGHVHGLSKPGQLSRHGPRSLPAGGLSRRFERSARDFLSLVVARFGDTTMQARALTELRPVATGEVGT